MLNAWAFFFRLENMLLYERSDAFMSIRRIYRTVLGMKYVLLNKLLMRDAGIVFNWEPVWKYAGHLSNRQQRTLGRLIDGYVNGHTVNIHNEYVFMKRSVEVFESMKAPYNQDEFDGLMNKI